MRRRVPAALFGLFLIVCAVLALTGFGHDAPGQVAALLLSIVVAGGGFLLRRRPRT